MQKHNPLALHDMSQGIIACDDVIIGGLLNKCIISVQGVKGSLK